MRQRGARPTIGSLRVGTALVASTDVVGLGWDNDVYVAAGVSHGRGEGYVLGSPVGYPSGFSFPAGYSLGSALSGSVPGRGVRRVEAIYEETGLR